MLEALDIAPGGEQYLPFAQWLLRRLKVNLNATGVSQGRKMMTTPDGAGRIIVRTRRDSSVRSAQGALYGFEADPAEWYDNIRIEVDIGGGYICSTSEIPNAKNPFAIKFFGDGGAIKIKPFLGYSYPPSPMTQLLDEDGKDKKDFLTAGLRTAGSARGWFRKQKFTPYTDSGSPVQRGAFLHKYTDPDTDEDKTRILVVKDDGKIYDSEDMSLLTSTGPTFSDPGNVTFQASADGRTVVIESKLTPGDPFDTSQPPLRNIRKAEVDFAATPFQVTLTDLAESGPFGSAPGTVEDPPGTFTTSGSSLLNAVTGVKEDGTIVNITIQHDVTTSITDTMVPGADHLGDGTTATTQAHQITVQLPDAVSASFLLTNSSEFIERHVTDHGMPGVNDGWDVTLSVDNSLDNALFKIIYADAAVPILVYELRTTSGSQAGGAAYSYGTGAPGDPVSDPPLGDLVPKTETYARKIGVLVGDQHLILAEENAVGTYTNVSGAKAGFRPAALGSIAAADYTRNQGSFKQLRRVDFQFDSTNGTVWYFGALTYGRAERTSTEIALAKKDMNPAYYIAARDVDNWIVGAFRKYDLDDNVVNRFQIWGGNQDTEDLTDAYFEYLIKAEQADTVPNTAYITAMEARDFSTFTPNMGGDGSRLPMV